MAIASDSRAATQDPADMTLDELKPVLAPLVAREAAFDGWGRVAVSRAAAEAGVAPDVAALALGDHAIDRVDAWIESVDAEMQRRLPPQKLRAMKIRERIASLVEARLDIMAPDREALRRAIAILAMPQNAFRASKIGWRSADLMWRMAGDTATDYNHYTKRALLLGIYTATLTVFLDDDSEAFAETRGFLARRIENVMEFEKAKAGFLKRRERILSLSRFVGRLRYPGV